MLKSAATIKDIFITYKFVKSYMSNRFFFAFVLLIGIGVWFGGIVNV